VSATTAGATAALFKNTVQVLEALAANVVVRHDKDVSCAGTPIETVNDLEELLRVAVIWAA